jgi:hypothetical protein
VKKTNSGKELLELMPTDIEMANLSKEVKKAVTSKAELLNIISNLKLSEMSLEERMIYALGLISLGFDESRARDRMNITNPEFYIWNQMPEHQAMFKQSISRGEMLLEERVLAAAEVDPEMAFRILERKEKKREHKEDKQQEEKKGIMDWMNESAKKRGLVIDAEIVDDVLK